MKNLSFFLALFFAFLIAFPCSDGFSVNENEIAHAQNHEENESTDFCSPFCVCSCCGAQYSSVKLEILSFEQLSTTIYEKISTFQYSVSFDVLYGIWQPPKIC